MHLRALFHFSDLTSYFARITVCMCMLTLTYRIWYEVQHDCAEHIHQAYEVEYFAVRVDHRVHATCVAKCSFGNIKSCKINTLMTGTLVT